MATKIECEKAIRHLATEWAKTQPDRHSPNWHPSFIAFCRWLDDNGNSHYLKFRSVAGPLEDAERWFDLELKQGWRS